MICSVYDSQRRIYTYYQCPGTARDYGARGTKFRIPNRPPEPSPGLGASATIGFAPDALAIVLPEGARPIGTGTHAKGVIAVPQGGDIVDSLLTQQGGGGPALRGALAGLGDTVVDEKIEVKSNLGQVVFAACVASIVGVFVQRALK
jgi:hypothetical protein